MLKNASIRASRALHDDLEIGAINYADGGLHFNANRCIHGFVPEMWECRIGASAVFTRHNIPESAVIEFSDRVVKNSDVIEATFHTKFDLVNRYACCFGAIYADDSIAVDENYKLTPTTMRFYKEEFSTGKYVIAFFGDNIIRFFERLDSKIAEYGDAHRDYVRYTDASNRTP